MITIPKYQPVNLDGPYRRRLRALEIAVSAIGHIALGTLLAYSVLGMIPGGDAMNRINRADLMRAYDNITKAAKRINSLMQPGAERSNAWIELNEARHILRDALTDGAPIDVKEAA